MNDDLLSALRREAIDDDAPAADRLPRTEAMMKTVHDAMAGLRPLSEAVDAVRLQRERLQRSRTRLAELTPQVADNPNARGFLAGLHVLNAGLGIRLNELENAVTKHDAARVEMAEKRVRRVMDALYDANERLVEATSPNRQGGLVMVPERFVALHKATDQVVKGRMNVRDWLTLIAAGAADIEARRARLKTQLAAIASDLDEGSRDLGLNLADAFDDCQRGLALMRGWAQSHEAAELNRGWAMLVNGIVSIQKSLHALGVVSGSGHLDDSVILEDE